MCSWVSYDTHTHLRNHCCHRAWAYPMPPRVCSGYVLSFAFSPSHPSLSPPPVPCKPPICSVAEDWFPCFRIFCGITEDVLFFLFLLSASFTQQNYFEIHACCCICPQSFLFCCHAVFCMDIPTTVYHSPAEERLVISGLRLLEIKLLWTRIDKFLCGHMLSFPLVGSFEEDWLDLELGTCLRF